MTDRGKTWPHLLRERKSWGKAAPLRQNGARLNRDFVKVIQLPEVKQLVGTQGNVVIGDTPEEFAAYIRAESNKWSKVIRQVGIKLD